MPMKSHEMIYVFSKAGASYNRIDVKTNKPDWKLDYTKKTTYALGSKQYGIDRKLEIREGKDGLRCPLSVVHVGGKLAGGHPTEKPEELYEWLLKRYVPENGTVLDPTAGSFNSCFVADRLGLTAIGIEKDNGFFEKAVKRLNG
jgi:site-specific DNA-methyltransferase (adenine-specific)